MRECCHNADIKRTLDELEVPQCESTTSDARLRARLTLLKERHQELQRVEKAWERVTRNFSREGFEGNQVTYEQVSVYMDDALYTIKQEDTRTYRYCPHCDSKVTLRERRPNGNSTCESGHVFPSSAERPSLDVKMPELVTLHNKQPVRSFPKKDAEGNEIVGTIRATLQEKGKKLKDRQEWGITKEGTATGLTNGRFALAKELTDVTVSPNSVNFWIASDIWVKEWQQSLKDQEQADHATSIKSQD